MGHMQAGEKTRFERTPPEWMPIGKQVGELANDWSERFDIVAFVGEGAGGGIAPACWRPDIAEMEIAVEPAFGEGADPEFIPDLTTRRNQFDYPVAMGAVLHEAGHAKHTLFSLVDLNELRAERETFLLAEFVEWFEESRIEQRMAARWPKNRSFLRACALKIVMGDMEEEAEELPLNGPLQLSKSILLSLARVDAGVLEWDDCKNVRKVAEDFFGTDVLDAMAEIWCRAQAWTEDHKFTGLRECAEDWIKLLEDNGHEVTPRELTDEEKQALKELMEAVKEAMGEDAEEAETRGYAESQDGAVHEAMEERAKAEAEDAKESREAEQTKKEVFGRGTGPVRGTMTSSRLHEEREPKAKEHAAAVTLAKALERARYRDRVVVKRTSQTPPGRLNGQAAMQREIDQSQGRMSAAEPWRGKRRFHTEDPELRIALMTDISGSMSSAMEPMGVATWMMAEAGRRIQAKVASVYYGNGVFAGLAPGEKLHKVKIYTAPDGTERFDMAFKSVNGALDLLHSSGARLLVISSDMCYTVDEVAAVKKWIKRCNEAGVAVVSLPFTTPGYVERATLGLDVQILNASADPAGIASQIGQACITALERAGNRA